jgi:hypothetical protein
MNRFLLVAAAVVVAGLSGCATPAHDISFDPQSGTGVVAIPGNSDMFPTYYRSAALDLIKQHVGPNYEILNEQTVPIGKTTVNAQQINGDRVNGVTTTQDTTEYQITYRKKMLPTTVTPGLPGMPGVPGAGGVQQTQYRPAAGMGAGIQPAGGIAPTGTPVMQAGFQQPGGMTTPGAQGNAIVPSVAPAGPAGSGMYGNAGATFGGMR